MKIFIISVSIALTLQAQNLVEILDSLQSSNKTKAILEKSKADIAQNEQFLFYDAPSIGASVSHADAIPAGDEDGLEYGLSFSQDLAHPFSSSQKNQVVGASIKAIQEETKYELHILKLNVIAAYHSSCVSREMQEKASFLYMEQAKRFEQIHTAYALGEISKKDLLFNKLDLLKLQQNVSVYKRKYFVELATLQSNVDTMNITTLECNDLLEPSSEITLNPLQEHGELKVMAYKVNSARAMYAIQDAEISSLSYEIGYEKELDTKIYTVGLSIPLDSMSSLKEKSKVQHLALHTSYLYEQDSLRSEIQNYSKSAVAKLEVLYDEYTLIQNEVLPLSKELMLLSKSALLEGEGDMMEYLDSTRSYSLNVLELLEIKKIYYLELFELYKIADLEFGEQK